MSRIGALLLCGLLTTVTVASEEPYKIVCYLGSWANYRQGDGKFVVEDIDTNLCTHLVYGFAKLGPDNRIASYDPYLDLKENWGLGAYERFTGLKKLNPSLKTLLAIGGWNEGSTKYSSMASDVTARSTFVQSVVEFCGKYGFDGLDLDWEYPANRGGKPSDKQNFVQLIKDLKEAFKSHNFLLTAAVSAGQATIDSAYDIPALGKYLDIINLMAYDFHGGWDRTTGHNSPLFPRRNDSEEQRKLNVDYAVKYWLSKGVPSHKLILGMPLYGRSFALQDAGKTGLNAPVNGKGMAGPFTNEQGFLGYNEICAMLKKEKDWKIVRDAEIRAPYTFKDKQWIGYDDIQSIAEKANYIVTMRLGGGMVWSIETDDFHGKCHGAAYPLLSAINDGFKGIPKPLIPDFDEDNTILVTKSETRPPATHHPGNEHTTKTQSPRSDDGDMRCPSAGYFRHPSDCRLFYVCEAVLPLFAQRDFVVHQFTCSKGTVFSEKTNTCDFPQYVPECDVSGD